MLRTFELIRIKKKRGFLLSITESCSTKHVDLDCLDAFLLSNFKFRVACVAGGIIFVRVRVLEALPREASPPHSAIGFAVPLLKPSSRERSRQLRRVNFVHSCY